MAEERELLRPGFSGDGKKRETEGSISKSSGWSSIDYAMKGEEERERVARG